MKTVNKYFLSILISLAGLLLGTHVVFAQQTVTSNCVVTKVGNPTDQTTVPPECQQSSPSTPPETRPGGKPTACKGTVVTLPVGLEKRLLPLPDESSTCARTATESCGRFNFCIHPTKIVLHTTVGTLTADDTYNWFASGAGGYGTGTHFTVGKDGKIIQMGELLNDRVEYMVGVLGYQNHISIEMGHSSIYGSKAEAPAAQYQATLNLVHALMKQYNIPIGTLEYTDKNTKTYYIGDDVIGVFGHYQLNPQYDLSHRSDPGEGWFRDFRADLKKM